MLQRRTEFGARSASCPEPPMQPDQFTADGLVNTRGTLTMTTRNPSRGQAVSRVESANTARAGASPHSESRPVISFPEGVGASRQRATPLDSAGLCWTPLMQPGRSGPPLRLGHRRRPVVDELRSRRTSSRLWSDCPGKATSSAPSPAMVRHCSPVSGVSTSRGRSLVRRANGQLQGAAGGAIMSRIRTLHLGHA